MAHTKTLELPVSWQEFSATEEDWDSVGPAQLVKMLMHAHLVRAFEEEMLKFDSEGLAHGPVHGSIGQEAGMVAALSCLGEGDMVGGSHRGHHVFLAKALNHVQPEGFDALADPVSEEVNELVYRTMAEILGLSPGFCKGRGGSMHLRWDEAGVIGTNAIVGGGVPLGALLASERAFCDMAPTAAGPINEAGSFPSMARSGAGVPSSS